MTHPGRVRKVASGDSFPAWSSDALPRGVDPNADGPAEQEEVDRLAQDVYVLTVTEIAAVERVGPS